MDCLPSKYSRLDCHFKIVSIRLNIIFIKETYQVPSELYTMPVKVDEAADEVAVAVPVGLLVELDGNGGGGFGFT
jgi:hypothetical protein